MSQILKLSTRAEIDEVAAMWTWRRDSGAVSATDERAFEAWMRRDPRHRRAMEELSQVWMEMDKLAGAKRSEDIAAFIRATQQAAERSHRSRWIAVAATILASVVGISWLQKGTESLMLATAVGQQRNFTLADGSRIALNPIPSWRRISHPARARSTCVKARPHFQVAHDSSRPFLVHAGDAVVRAVGTEFEVRLRSDRHVKILVNEGRVEVRAAEDASPEDALGVRSEPRAVAIVQSLSAGQQLSTAIVDYSVVPLSPVQLSSELAWREGAIIFDGEPLSEAIAEIERYTDVRIVVSDSRIVAMRVGGRFKTDNLQGFFDGLQAALPVTIRRTVGGPVYIDPRL